MALAFACFLVACGDGSSSNVIPDPFGDRLSSPGGDDENISSSSASDKGMSSVGGLVSSSSSEGCSFSGRNEDGSPDFAGVCCDDDTAILMSGKYTQYFTCEYNVWLRDSIGGQDTVKPYAPHPNMEKQFASKIDYETFVDERDGQEYKIVTIKSILMAQGMV